MEGVVIERAQELDNAAQVGALQSSSDQIGFGGNVGCRPILITSSE